jgi:dipeptide/tripeptide permease
VKEENNENTYDKGCTITLSGKHNWEDVDTRAKQLGLLRSRYISYAVDKEIDRKNRRKYREALMLILIILIFFTIIIQIMGLI